MFKIINSIEIKISFIGVFTGVLLFSCTDENRIHSNYIPDNACAVININSEKIINDAAFDLMLNNDLGGGFSLLPLSGILKDPSSAGIKLFTKYHVFISGSTLFDVRLGAILPLEDSEDLVEYIEENLKVEVVENKGLKIVEISPGHNLIWDDYTALYYFGKSQEGLIEEGKKLFNQSEKESLASKDSTFSYTLGENVHTSAWIKNKDFIQLINQASLGLGELNAFDFLLKENQTLEDGKTVFFTSFNKGNISVRHRHYFNSGKIKKDTIKAQNYISSLVPMAISENPMVLISASIHSDVFAEIIKLFGFDLGFHKQIADFSVSPTINQFSEYLQRDVLVLIDGFEEVKKIKEVPDLDDEGNDILISKEVVEKNPVVSFGLGIKDSIKFNFMMNLLSSDLPKVDGFFNYNDELYFTVKGDYFFLTSAKKGIKPLIEMNGKLSKNLNSAVEANQTVYYFDVIEILQKDQRFSQLSTFGFDELNNILIFNNGGLDKGISEGEVKVNFKNQQNSFVSSLKLFSELVNALNFSDSIGIQ